MNNRERSKQVLDKVLSNHVEDSWKSENESLYNSLINVGANYLNSSNNESGLEDYFDQMVMIRE